MRKLAWFLFGALALLAVIALGGGVFLIGAHGFSAREQPGALERWTARRARSMAVPAGAKDQANPSGDTPEVLADARAHWADHWYASGNHPWCKTGQRTAPGAALLAGGDPVVRQELIELVDWIRGDARKHIAKPRTRVDLHAFTGSHEGPQHRRCLAPVVAAKERPVVPSDCDAAERPLGGRVIDLQIAVFAIARQSGPVVEGISRRLTGRTLRKQFLPDAQQISVQLAQHRPCSL